jgi:hypothetical protein
MVHAATPMCTGSRALIPCHSPRRRKKIFSPPRALAPALLHHVLPLHLLLPSPASHAANHELLPRAWLPPPRVHEPSRQAGSHRPPRTKTADAIRFCYYGCHSVASPLRRAPGLVTTAKSCAPVHRSFLSTEPAPSTSNSCLRCQIPSARAAASASTCTTASSHGLPLLQPCEVRSDA